MSKYTVFVGGGICEVDHTTDTNSAVEAVKLWCDGQKTRPSCCHIFAEDQVATKDFYLELKEHFEEVQEMLETSQEAYVWYIVVEWLQEVDVRKVMGNTRADISLTPFTYG